MGVVALAEMAVLAGPGDLMAVGTVDPGALDLEEVVAAPTLEEIATLVLVVVQAEAPLPIFLTPTKTVQIRRGGPMTRRRLV